MTVLQATAIFAGAGAVTANTWQKWSSIASLVGAGQAAELPNQRMLESVQCVGTGHVVNNAGIIWSSVAAFTGRAKVKVTAAPIVAQSEAFIVRDKIMARLQRLSFFSNFAKFSTNTAEQIQPENIPFLGVYYINDDYTADGDDNVGDVRFRVAANYGVSIIIQNNDGAAAERKLDQGWKAFTRIFSDATLYNWKNAASAWRDGSEVLIQSYRRGNRSHVFGSVGKENAIPIAEMRFNLTCDLGILTYDPVITDDFNTMHVTTIYPGGDDPAAIAARQQVEAEIDIPQN